MTHTPFLTKLKVLLNDRGRDAIYPCILDLVVNGLTLARFSSGDRIPSRQEVTQYIGAWCRHAGLTEEDCRDWLMEYCTVMLSSISKSSLSAIRHSTGSNVKYIYKADVPFECECDSNPFKAQCNSHCTASAGMQASLAERKDKRQNRVHNFERPEAVLETGRLSIKETYRDQFESTLLVIRGEIEKGTSQKTILGLLNGRGLKTRTGRQWTVSILGNEIRRMSGSQESHSDSEEK